MQSDFGSMVGPAHQPGVEVCSKQHVMLLQHMIILDGLKTKWIVDLSNRQPENLPTFTSIALTRCRMQFDFGSMVVPAHQPSVEMRKVTHTP